MIANDSQKRVVEIRVPMLSFPTQPRHCLDTLRQKYEIRLKPQPRIIHPTPPVHWRYQLDEKTGFVEISSSLFVDP